MAPLNLIQGVDRQCQQLFHSTLILCTASANNNVIWYGVCLPGI